MCTLAHELQAQVDALQTQLARNATALQAAVIPGAVLDAEERDAAAASAASVPVLKRQLTATQQVLKKLQEETVC